MLRQVGSGYYKVAQVGQVSWGYDSLYQVISG